MLLAAHSQVLGCEDWKDLPACLGGRDQTIRAQMATHSGTGYPLHRSAQLRRQVGAGIHLLSPHSCPEEEAPSCNFTEDNRYLAEPCN